MEMTNAPGEEGEQLMQDLCACCLNTKELSSQNQPNITPNKLGFKGNEFICLKYNMEILVASNL